MSQIQDSKTTPIVFLRGLDARCLWAAAHVGGVPESSDGSDDAFAQGIRDFECGRAASDVPPLLADISELAAAWREGWKWADEVNDMASCAHCQDSNIDVCPIHG